MVPLSHRYEILTAELRKGCAKDREEVYGVSENIQKTPRYSAVTLRVTLRKTPRNSAKNSALLCG